MSRDIEAANILLQLGKMDSVSVPQSTLNDIFQKLSSLEEQIKKLSSVERKDSFEDSTIVEFKVYKKSILVTGNTKPYRELLKKYKASWNPTLKGWIMNREKGRKCAKKFNKKYEDITNIDESILEDSDSDYTSSD